MTNNTDTNRALADAVGTATELRAGERGAGVVEWLGISALAVTLLVGLFASLTTVGDQLIQNISSSLGL